MAVTTSVVFDFVDALLTKIRANTVIAAGPYNLQIVDGPPTNDVARPNILFVGASPLDEQGLAPDATFTQRWGELGARSKYEEISVRCELWVRDGGTDMAARRASAKAILGQIEADLRTGFTLGLGPLGWCTVEAGALTQIQSRSAPGSTVKVQFTIAGKARLPSQ